MHSAKTILVVGGKPAVRLMELADRPARYKATPINDGLKLQTETNSSFRFRLNPGLLYFFSDEKLSPNGLPLAGALHRDDMFQGDGALSCFDVSWHGLNHGIYIDGSPQMHWRVVRIGSELHLTLEWAREVTIRVYKGCEPDWSRHPFPFRHLPKCGAREHHALVRGLLDFFGGTRGESNATYVYQKPNTNAGYPGDGIVDTYFQFLGAYPYISELRRSYLEIQINWLGDNMRFDGCVPWGKHYGKPYYHIQVRPENGLFFDGNALWLDMTYRIWRWTGKKPDMVKVLRAVDFYLHYMTPDGLVAAESKMLGCEWADILKNGWHSSLINVLAYRAFWITEQILRAVGERELAGRYQGHRNRLRTQLNLSVEEGGLWKNNGYVDWRDPDGRIHSQYRIDTHALAILFGVPTNEQISSILDKFEAYSWSKEIPPAPYLISGNWKKPEDDMLDGCSAWDGGLATMCGRCGGTLTAALNRCNHKRFSRKLLDRLVDMVAEEKGIPEYYHPDGRQKLDSAYSYIEHALSVNIAWTLQSSKDRGSEKEAK